MADGHEMQRIPPAIQAAADRVEIQEVMARYAAAVDSRRWELLDQVFMKGSVVDFGPNGGVRDEYPGIVDYLRTAMAGFAAYQHYLSNFVTQVDGDRATSRFYVWTPLVTIVDGRDDIIVDGGFYDATFVRTPDGWRVEQLVSGLVWIDDKMAQAIPTPPWYGVSSSRY
jgi:hypothetical protein